MLNNNNDNREICQNPHFEKPKLPTIAGEGGARGRGGGSNPLSRIKTDEFLT